MQHAISYVAAAAVFFAMDAVWLKVMGERLYRPTLGDILLPEIRIAPAVAFYLLYPVGLVFLAVLPGLRAGSFTTTLMSAALLGAIAYATYDLTNLATLRNWTVQITLIDIVWGAFTSAVAASLAYVAASQFR